MTLKILIAIFILLAAVTIHEFGHYFAARVCGVRVEEFSIGIGPVLFRQMRHGIRYSLRILPLGGFCAFETDDENRQTDEKIPASMESDRKGILLEHAPIFKRLWILSNGILMNIITALCLMVLVYLYYGVGTMTVERVLDHSPAMKAEIEPGDRIIAIDDTPLTFLSQLQNSASYQKEAFVLTIVHDGMTRKVLIRELGDGSDGKGKLGVVFQHTRKLDTILHFATASILQMALEFFQTVQRLFAPRFSKNVMGPIGFAQWVGSMSALPLSAIAMLMVAISISLACFNLLPIPPLDGGQILLLCLEWIPKEHIRSRIRYFLIALGIGCIGYIFLRTLLQDIGRLI